MKEKAGMFKLRGLKSDAIHEEKNIVVIFKLKTC